MIPYFLLIAIPFLFTAVTFQKEKQLDFQGITEKKSILRSINWTLPIFFLLLFLMLALRGETVGSDTVSYKRLFSNIRVQTLATTIGDGDEALYRVCNWIIGRITDNFQWFIVIMSAIMVLPIVWIYNKEREYSLLKLLIFVNMPTFVMMFSGIRQALAISCGIVAFHFAQRKKVIPFLLTVLVAMGFHASAIILLAIYPLYYVTLKVRHLWIAIPAMIVVFVFNEPIFLFLANKVYSAYVGENGEIKTTETGAYTTLILFVVLLVLSYLVMDEKKMDGNAFALRNILAIATVMQSFTLVHQLAMRMNYYFIIFVPLAVAKIFLCAKDEFKPILKWVEILLCVFFTAYFVWSIVDSYLSGFSSLGTVPYAFFWE